MKTWSKHLIISLVVIFAFLALGASFPLVVNDRVKFEKGITLGDIPKTTYGLGTVGSTAGKKVAEYGDGIIHKSVITLNETLSFNDVSGASTSAYEKIYDFPAGIIKILGATVDCDITTTGCGGYIVADADGDFSLGTAAANTTNSLSGTEADIIASAEIAQLATSTGPIVGYTAAAGSVHDGHTTATDLYINILFDDADSSADTTVPVLAGTVTVYWMNLGDY